MKTLNEYIPCQIIGLQKALKMVSLRLESVDTTFHVRRCFGQYNRKESQTEIYDAMQRVNVTMVAKFRFLF
jgi:hypothetical protein